MSDTTPRIGVWFAGARGSVSTTAIVGALAIAQRLVGRTGLVSELPELAGVVLPDFEDLVFGGHDVDPMPLPRRAELLANAGVVPGTLVRKLVGDLGEVDHRIRQVSPLPAGRQAEYAARIEHDLREFRDRQACDRVVVVNLSSAEPPLAASPGHADLDALERAPLGRRLGSLAEIGYTGLVSVEPPRHSHAAPTVAARSLALLRSAARAVPAPAGQRAVPAPTGPEGR